jgi:iron complex outermembrane receptor protein
MCKARVILASLAVGVIFYSRVFGQEEGVELEKIVVTPYRFPEEINRIPAYVTIITDQEIRKSNAQTIPDILRTETGLVVRDFYGTGIKVSVDLRGFGEMAGSNTLVLVDGRRINEVDLSGVAWAQIPLDQVEKIEVVRGAGSVLYGDNAVGGVINIITKTGKGKPSFEIETSAGSYQMNKERLELSGSTESISYLMELSSHSTNGYRQNSYYRAGDFGGKLIYNATDQFSVNLSGNYHEADFGLPGALRESQLRSSVRRDTKFPDDDVGEEDWYMNLGTKNEVTENFKLTTNLSFRRREADSYLLTSQSIDGRRIDTLGFTPSFMFQNELLGKNHKLIAGIDFYRSDSLIDAYSFFGLSYYQGAKTRETDIDKQTLGYYLQDEVQIKDNLIFLCGYRLERANYTFDSTPQNGPWTSDIFWNSTQVDQDLDVDEEAVNFGLNYLYNDTSKIFVQYTRNFRFPVIDEYYSIWASPPVNINLLPQTAHTYETGIEHQFGKFLKSSLTLFDMKLKNELYYDPLLFENKNYDKTEHRGIEYALEWKYKDYLTVTGNYTFTEASFKGGTYNRNKIPIVPTHKASIGTALNLNPNWQFNMLLNYTGERYFINDQANNYPKLDDFITIDVKLSYKKYKNFSAYCGVNNLFDKEYSEYGAISTVYNERGYYPSPGRNFIIGGSLQF